MARFDGASQLSHVILQLATNRIEGLPNGLRQLFFALMIGNQFCSRNGEPHTHSKWSAFVMVMDRGRFHHDFAMTDAIVIGIEGGDLLPNLGLDGRQEDEITGGYVQNL